MSRFYGIQDYESLVFDEDRSSEEEAFGPVPEGETGSGPEGEWVFEDLDSPDGEWSPEELSPEILQELSAEDFPPLMVDLITEDGNRLRYEAMGVFLVGDCQYMALHPEGEAREGEIPVELMRYTKGPEDELVLLPIEDEEEFAAASQAFYQMMGDDGA